MVKAADMLIARRADTRARADFATWKMMAKLNGASSLPADAQTLPKEPGDLPPLLRGAPTPQTEARHSLLTALVKGLSLIHI